MTYPIAGRSLFPYEHTCTPKNHNNTFLEVLHAQGQQPHHESKVFWLCRRKPRQGEEFIDWLSLSWKVCYSGCTLNAAQCRHLSNLRSQTGFEEEMKSLAGGRGWLSGRRRVGGQIRPQDVSLLFYVFFLLCILFVPPIIALVALAVGKSTAKWAWVK